MGAKAHIGKWGSSLAVRIPRAVAEQCGLSEGSAMEMEVQGGRIVMRKSSYDLADMLDRITAANLHPETDFGGPEGEEPW